MEMSSVFNYEEETTMKPAAIGTLLGIFSLFLIMGSLSYAQEAKGPTQFNLAILEEHNVSFVVPSALIVDERGKVSGLTLAVTNIRGRSRDSRSIGSGSRRW
jgi:hypothetical protein